MLSAGVGRGEHSHLAQLLHVAFTEFYLDLDLFLPCCVACGVLVPQPGILKWELRGLTTRPQGKCPTWYLNFA